MDKPLAQCRPRLSSRDRCRADNPQKATARTTNQIRSPKLLKNLRQERESGIECSSAMHGAIRATDRDGESPYSSMGNSGVMSFDGQKHGLILGMQSTFGFCKSTPSSRPLIFSCQHGSRARPTSNACCVTLVMKWVVGDVMLGDESPDFLLRPVG